MFTFALLCFAVLCFNSSPGVAQRSARWRFRNQIYGLSFGRESSPPPQNHAMQPAPRSAKASDCGPLPTTFTRPV